MTFEHDETWERPKARLGLIVAIVLTGVMTWRISALTYLSQVGDTLPEFWGIAFKGDAFIGVTAPIVAYLLYKHRTLSVWTLGVVWQCIGLFDLWVAIESQFIFSIGQAPNYVIPTGMVMHAVALVLLLRARGVFLNAPT